MWVFLKYALNSNTTFKNCKRVFIDNDQLRQFKTKYLAESYVIASKIGTYARQKNKK